MNVFGCAGLNKSVQKVAILIALMSAFVCTKMDAQTNSATLLVQIDGVKPGRGDVLLSAFASAEGWPDQAAAVVWSARIPATASTVSAQTLLPPGRYAISCFQDHDGNNTLSTNWLGIPNEPYGFSNNARRLTGPPYFENAAFDLPATGSTQRFSIR